MRIYMVGTQAWTSERDNGEKTEWKRVKYLEFRFENEVVGNGSDCNVKLGGRFSNRAKGYGYLGSVVREKEGIAA